MTHQNLWKLFWPKSCTVKKLFRKLIICRGTWGVCGMWQSVVSQICEFQQSLPCYTWPWIIMEQNWTKSKHHCRSQFLQASMHMNELLAVNLCSNLLIDFQKHVLCLIPIRDHQKNLVISWSFKFRFGMYLED